MVESDTEKQQNQAEEQIIDSANIHAVITRKIGCQVHIEAKVAPIAVKAAYDKAFKTIKKEVSIQGFRKGKAPDHIVGKEYKSHIDREWRSLTLRTAFNEILDEAKIKPFSENSIRRADLKKCSLEDGAECVFDLEVEPQVPDIDPSRFHVEKTEPKEVTDSDITHELENIRLSRAAWSDITDRPCQANDYVEIDVDVIENPAHNLFTNRLFRVEKEHMPEWLLSIVPGMNPGEAKEAMASTSTCSSHDPQHTHSESCQEQNKKVLVTLKTIKQAALPEENDELATQCGYPNMDEFKKALREIIQKHRVESIQEHNRMEIYGQLLEVYPIDVPKALIEAETKSRFEYVRRHSRVKKGELPMDKEKEQLLKAQIAYEAKGFIECMYLLQRLAQKIDMTVMQDELMHEYTVETVYVPYNQRLIYPGMAPEEIRSRLYTKIMMRKGIDYILSHI